MSLQFGRILIIATCILEFSFSCNSKYRNRESIEMAMRNYDHLLLNMEVDSISMMYTPDGDLGGMAHGRDSIRILLNRFKNFKVLSQSSNTVSVIFNHDTAVQEGSYHQKTIVPPNDTVFVKGTFVAKWIWLKDGGWHIKRMETHSIP